MLNRKNRLFKNYKNHGYKVEDKVRLDTLRIECQQAVETAKLSYLRNLGNKDHIISLVRAKSKSIFGIHDPLRLRYLFQLRVKLSPLRSHKKHHNFIDTPSETCHCNLSIEDVSHFLFACPSSANERATLAINVIEILQRYNLNHLGNQLELYLYGHQSIDVTDNRKILLSAITYIKGTRRFAT